ncbi:hypothetical protein OS493_038206 [Desmophyllum pertusum]|uniref:ILEI/PANDER domain-containing protein n=1 Tax=Desmophyllum pertusum TaxID=174260 RepID=A0A9W9ZI35_9CNID|nr:hypothetical protein OS493_038206 [Desmophyllum pertusum]
MGEEIEQLKNPRTTRPPTPTITEAQVRLVDIHLRSEGCDDPGKTPNTCGIAYIKVDGKDYSLHGRGHNVVIVDAKTGAVLEAKSFDTYAVSNAGNSLGSYLDSKNGHQIVLVAVQDSASTYQAPAIDALKRKGATDPVVDFRGSFALVGYAQANITRPLWIAQQRRNSGQGPSEISLKNTTYIKCVRLLSPKDTYLA